jgi:hypothetical protein
LLRLQEIANPLFGARPHLSPAPQIEDESRIAKRLTTEAGRWRAAAA